MTKLEKRSSKKHKAHGAAHRGADQAQNPSMTPPMGTSAEMSDGHIQSQTDTGMVSHKGRQKRFGHN